jgi:hypothetical protein
MELSIGDGAAMSWNRGKEDVRQKRRSSQPEAETRGRMGEDVKETGQRPKRETDWAMQLGGGGGSCGG